MGRVQTLASTYVTIHNNTGATVNKSRVVYSYNGGAGQTVSLQTGAVNWLNGETIAAAAAPTISSGQTLGVYFDGALLATISAPSGFNMSGGPGSNPIASSTVHLVGGIISYTNYTVGDFEICNTNQVPMNYVMEVTARGSGCADIGLEDGSSYSLPLPTIAPGDCLMITNVGECSFSWVISGADPSNGFEQGPIYSGTNSPSVSTNQYTGTITNSNLGTITSSDPFANIPLRPGISTNQAQADRQNAEGISKAIGQAGDKLLAGLGGGSASGSGGKSLADIYNVLTNGTGGGGTNQLVADGSQVSTNASYFQGLGSGWGGTVTNGIVGLQTNANSITGVVQVATVDSAFFQFNLLGQEIDLLDNEEMMWAAEWMRNLILWVSGFYIMFAVWNEVKETILKIGSFQQGSSPNIGGSILGVGVQSELFMHPITFGIVAAAIAVFVVVIYSAVSGLASGTFSVVWLNPFDSSHVFIQQAGYIISLFIPVTSLIAQWVAFALFKLGVASASLIAQLAIRATPGLILLSFLSFDVQAQNLTIENFTTNNVRIHDGSYSFILMPAQKWAADIGSTLDLYDPSGSNFVTLVPPASGFLWVHCVESNGFPTIRTGMERVSLWQAVSLGARFGGVLLVGMITFWFVAFLRRPQNPETVGT